MNLTISQPEEARNWLLDYAQCIDNGIYLEPSVNMLDLYNLLKSGLHHSSAIYAKVNILLATFEPTKYVTASEFQKLVLSYLVTGNLYMEPIFNRVGQLIKVEALPAMYMRRSNNIDDYFLINSDNSLSKYKQDQVVHILEPDLKQEMYGLPQYLAAYHSIKLNESATLFRRRYYDNGSHAGFILYSTDPKMNEADTKELKHQLRQTKGNGAFKNVFLRAPNGKPDGLTLIPISEIAAKDEFLNIKQTTRDDMLAAHRIPPQLIGAVPSNAGGFGDITKAAAVFAVNEVNPIQVKIKEANELTGYEIFKFKPYKIVDES